ncbi:hypothetical protein ACM66B_006658 [Microbotryomycetes sp. NB124-2]
MKSWLALYSAADTASDTDTDEDALRNKLSRARATQSSLLESARAKAKTVLRPIQPPPAKDLSMTPPYSIVKRPAPLDMGSLSQLSPDTENKFQADSKPKPVKKQVKHADKGQFLDSVQVTAFRDLRTHQQAAQTKETVLRQDTPIPVSKRMPKPELANKVAKQLRSGRKAASGRKALELAPVEELESEGSQSLGRQCDSTSNLYENDGIRYETRQRRRKAHEQVLKPSSPSHQLMSAEKASHWCNRQSQHVLVSDSEKSVELQVADARRMQLEELRRLPTPPESRFRFVTAANRDPARNRLRPPLVLSDDDYKGWREDRQPAQWGPMIHPKPLRSESDVYGAGGNVAHPSLLLQSSQLSDHDDGGGLSRQKSSDSFDQSSNLRPLSRRTSFSSLTRVRPHARIQRSRTTHIQPPRFNDGLVRRVNTTLAPPNQRSSSVMTDITKTMRVGSVAKPSRRLSTRPLFRLPTALPLPQPVSPDLQKTRRATLDLQPSSNMQQLSSTESASAGLLFGHGIENPTPAQQGQDDVFNSSMRLRSDARRPELLRGCEMHGNSLPLAPTPFADLSTDDHDLPHTSELDLPQADIVVDYLPTHPRGALQPSTAERIAEAEKLASRYSTDSAGIQIEGSGTAHDSSQAGPVLQTSSFGQSSFALQERDFAVVDRLAYRHLELVQQAPRFVGPKQQPQQQRRLRGPPPPSDPTALVSLPSTFASTQGQAAHRHTSIKRATTVWAGRRVDSLGVVNLESLVKGQLQE